MVNKLFKLRGQLDSKTSFALSIGGILFILLVWFLITMGENPIVKNGVIPKPFDVLAAFGELYQEKNLIRNMFQSIGINLAGYVEAVIIAIPIGFMIGLFPIFRGSFSNLVDAIRYVPLGALTVVFISWFGIGVNMKAHFLAFGIIIYLLPTIVQRINEVKDVYLKTVYTLGASPWQTIKTVYFPSVMSRLSDDIRVLTAISWTYIVVAEGINSQGGLGSLIFFAGSRFRRLDIVFAVLIIIMIIGVFQDRIFVHLDKKFFPHKFQTKNKYSNEIKDETAMSSVSSYFMNTLIWILIALYVLLVVNEYLFPFIGDFKLFDYLFGDTCWAIHFIFLLILTYKGNQFYRKITSRKKINPKPTAA